MSQPTAETALDQAAAVLERYRHRGARPSLDRMAWLCTQLGHPERLTPAIHVTGTNGKGSTTKMTAALLGGSGLRVGQYISPHLRSITERIVVDGGAITDAEFAGLVSELGPLFDGAEAGCGEGVTHFDALTAMALVAFQRVGTDALVLEAGIGGRWDATNVVPGRVAVVTNVDMDHTELLGATPAVIAAEKVGVIKPGAVAILGEPTPPVSVVFEQQCAEVGASAWVAGREIHVAPGRDGRTRISTPGASYDVRVPFRGPHQTRNAACALAAAEAFLGRSLAPESIERAFTGLVNPGHFEILGHPARAVVDVAHNPHGIGALVSALADAGMPGGHVVVLSVGREKDAETMLAVLRPAVDLLVLTQALPDAPSRDTSDLARMAARLGYPEVICQPSPLAAIEEADRRAGTGRVVVCTGSHYWIGAVYDHLLARFGPTEAPGPPAP